MQHPTLYYRLTVSDIVNNKSWQTLELDNVISLRTAASLSSSKAPLYLNIMNTIRIMINKFACWLLITVWFSWVHWNLYSLDWIPSPRSKQRGGRYTLNFIRLRFSALTHYLYIIKNLINKSIIYHRWFGWLSLSRISLIGTDFLSEVASYLLTN